MYLSGGIGQGTKMQKAIHSISNPKDSAGFWYETNDCAVRALANAFDVGYAKAHSVLKAAGRQDKKGTPVDMIHNVVLRGCDGKRGYQLHHIGKGWEAVGKRQVTIGTFCKYHTKGRFYCIVKGHALAIVDGVVQDSGRNRPGRRIYKAYEILEVD